MNGNKSMLLKLQQGKCNFTRLLGSIASVTYIVRFTSITFFSVPILGTITDLVFFALAPAYQSSSHPGFRSIILHAINRQLKNICPWDSRPETHAPQITTSDSSYPPYQA